MLTSRQKNIINYLRSVTGYTTVKELSDYFSLSQRSIQYDLQNIEYYADKQGVDISRDKRYGIKINQKNVIKDNMLEHQEDYVVYSPEIRVQKILLHLFSVTEPISSNKLAKKLFVTRRTIVDDLKSVKEWLTDFFLELSYIQNKGFCISGEEQKIREAYAELIKEHDNIANVSKCFLGDESGYILAIKDMVETILDEEKYKVIQEAQEYLIVHVLITIYRVSKNFRLEYISNVLEKLKQEKEFQIAQLIKEQINEKCDVELSESDVGYITLHLLGAKQDSDTKLGKKEKDFFNNVLDTFIKRLSGFMGVDLTSDPALIKGLAIHLKPALNRLKFQLRYSNPLKNEILTRYPDMVETVKSSIPVLEEAYNVDFDMDEITYLALHIQSAVERKFEKTRYILKVIIVCSSGVGTSQLLKAKIENYYPELKVHDTFSVYDIEDDYFKKHEINFVITTIPINDYPIPVIQVTPFLNKVDRKKLNEVLMNEREKVIKTVLTPGPNLNELLTPELILWDVNASNWEEAVEASVEPLVTNGIVTNAYTNAIKERIELHGSYMVIEKGVAMPHASPADGVIRPGFSLVWLKKPICFGNEQYDPVSVIICLATTDAHIHLNALRQLSLILQDDQYKKKLMEGNYNTVKSLIDEISNY